MVSHALEQIEAKLAALDLYAGEDVDIEVLRSLEDAGVDLPHVTNVAGPVCHALVSFIEGGLFGYDPLGMTSCLLVVHDEDAETEIDVVAWPVREADLFGLLLGRAALLGGDRVLNPASYYGGNPCPLWRTPLRWLQEGCGGAVVLQAIPASATLATVAGKLAAEDEAHARELVASGAVRRDKIVFPVAKRRTAA